MLTEAVAELISEDMMPLSTVDGQGFLNLKHVAEPRYTVPCRKMVIGIIDQRYVSCTEGSNWQLSNPTKLPITS